MKVGVIGAGKVGGGLARLWDRAGHEVRVSTRDTVAETASFAEVVVLAVPDTAVAEVLSAAGPLDGKVLVDATNAFSGASTAADVARLVPGARVVKAFNTLFAPLYDQISAADRPPSLVYCGDDAGAKETVAQLIRDIGLEPVDAGGLDVAGHLESFALLIIGIAYRQGRGPFVYRFEAP
ncbi:MAG: NADPH-dependent F420 reductase [Gaiellaceae bacterium]